MAKTVSIIAVLGCIHTGEEVHIPGGPAFDCDQKEAKRLIGLGVAALATEADQAPPAGNSQTAADEAAAVTKAALLAAISAAITTEELLALLPEEEPEADIAEAFTLRHAQLEPDH